MERGFVRIVATGGVVGVATILGAVLVSQDVAGSIVGLAVGLTSVILARGALVVAAALTTRRHNPPDHPAQGGFAQHSPKWAV